MVKVHSVFQNISAEVMFDVLHDPDYRKEWDEHMIDSIEVGYLNPNNDIGYYACKIYKSLQFFKFTIISSLL